MLKFASGLAAGITLFAVIVAAYFLGKGQLPKTSSPTPTTVVNTLVASPSALPVTSDFVNPGVTISVIGEAIPAKNYSDLASYMTDQVNVILYASECCGQITKSGAITQLEYLKSAISPWDFSDNNPTAAKLAKADPTNFKDHVVGTSSNRYAVSFHLNDQYLIDKIFLVGDWKLIAP